VTALAANLVAKANGQKSVLNATTAISPISLDERVRRLKEKNLLIDKSDMRPASGRSGHLESVEDEEREPLGIPGRPAGQVSTPPQSARSERSMHPLSQNPSRSDPSTPPLESSLAPQQQQIQQPTDNAQFPVNWVMEAEKKNHPDNPAPMISEAENNGISPPTMDNKIIYTSASRATDTEESKVNSSSRPPLKLTNSTTQIERNFDAALRDIYGPTTQSMSPELSSMDQKQRSLLVARRRIRKSSFESLKSVTRKPISSVSGVEADLANSTRKQLPKSPPEKESLTLICSLRAQIDDLTRQRVNMEKSIHAMTELIPPSTLHGLERHRQSEEKRKVDVLKERVADVRKQEHELGLRLHRAWKREAEASTYEPTSLWVRRVTG
jgi:hypothetical protein